MHMIYIYIYVYIYIKALAMAVQQRMAQPWWVRPKFKCLMSQRLRRQKEAGKVLVPCCQVKSTRRRHLM